MTTSSVQRSFRLARRTAERLDAAAEASGETRNSLAERLLDEALKTDQHPLIRFRSGAAGRREPTLVGTRLRVRDVITTVRAEGNDLEAAADYLSVSMAIVSAAVAYFADYRDEIAADMAWADKTAASEHARWDRQQAALA